MSSQARIRQLHRWLSMVFTLAVIANFVAASLAKEALWLRLVALFPLFLLWLTGLYLFILPYAARWRRGLPSN